MNLISDILFWISNGLLVPVVVLLIVLFIRSLLLIGSFFGQYLAIRRTDALLRQQLDALTIDTLPELESKLPVKSNSLVIVYIRRVLGSKDRPAHVQRLLADFEITADKDLAISKTLTKPCTTIRTSARSPRTSLDCRCRRTIHSSWRAGHRRGVGNRPM